MSPGIEIDWIVVRVHTARRLGTILMIAFVAALLVVYAYLRLNLPPDAQARLEIERAETAYSRVTENPVPDIWASELEQAEEQLEAARVSYGEENWPDSINLARGARTRFEALLGAGKHEVVGVGQVFSMEGRVTVQRAGEAEWTSAHQNMPVFTGDFVRTGRDGSAEIMFADGTLYRIAPNSLLEIHQPRRADEGAGSVKMRVGHINVYTSGSPSTVSTDSTQTRVEEDSRVALDVGDEGNRTVVATYKGSASIRNPAGEEIKMSDREQIVADAQGAFSEKQQIPDPPRPLEPQNNHGFELGKDESILLRWGYRPDMGAVRLQVSRSRRFIDDLVDVDVDSLRKGWARLQPISAGIYYWRIATIGDGLTQSDWSPVRKFQIFSSSQQVLLEDRTPPELEYAPPQQLGQMFIIEGRSEVGATVTINGEPVEQDGAGRFRKTVEVTQEGWNELVIAAVDPSGNRTEFKERVYVEVY